MLVHCQPSLSHKASHALCMGALIPSMTYNKQIHHRAPAIFCPMPADDDILHVHQSLLEEWIIQALRDDGLKCISFASPQGFLVRVLPPEYDIHWLPTELQTLVRQARSQQLKWLLIDAPAVCPSTSTELPH